MHILEQVPIDNYKNKVKKLLRKCTRYDTIKMCLAKKLGTIEDVHN